MEAEKLKELLNVINKTTEDASRAGALLIQMQNSGQFSATDYSYQQGIYHMAMTTLGRLAGLIAEKE